MHSYALEGAEVQALRARGVAVSRRLHEGLVAALVQAVRVASVYCGSSGLSSE
jgi:hypothetical protein